MMQGSFIWLSIALLLLILVVPHTVNLMRKDACEIVSIIQEQVIIIVKGK